MITQEFTLPVNSGEMDVYLSRPLDGTGPHPAVIVLQEIYGVNDEIRRITDLLAGIGYVGLAINFYHRTHPRFCAEYDDEGMQRGIQAASATTRQGLRTDLQAAMDWLNAQDFVRSGKIATWGFCFGGTAAFLSATLDGVSGAICFYGGGIARGWGAGEAEGLADVAQVRAPLLLCFGGNDPSIPSESIERIERTLRDAGKEAQIQLYPNVGHAFFRHGRPQAVRAAHASDSDEAVSEAVADSWGLVQSFLRRCFTLTTATR